jgi:hypothetical protein
MAQWRIFYFADGDYCRSNIWGNNKTFSFILSSHALLMIDQYLILSRLLGRYFCDSTRFCRCCTIIETYAVAEGGLLCTAAALVAYLRISYREHSSNYLLLPPTLLLSEDFLNG